MKHECIILIVIEKDQFILMMEKRPKHIATEKKKFLPGGFICVAKSSFNKNIKKKKLGKIT